jgi:hypothetical protein
MVPTEQDEILQGGGAKKTSKLTTIDKQADSGRRLVEYFVVVSSVEREPGDEAKRKDDPDMPFSEWKTESNSYDEEDEYGGVHFRPTITARYPLHDHADNPLHENLTLFCHPSGGIQLRMEKTMPKVRMLIDVFIVYTQHCCIIISILGVVSTCWV